MVRFSYIASPFPDEQKTIYFAVFFPSSRIDDKSNHFGELKTTQPFTIVREYHPGALANEHSGEPQPGNNLHVHTCINIH